MVWPSPFAALRKLFRPTPSSPGGPAPTPDSLRVIEEWPIYPLTGWTIEEVQGAISNMEVGNLRTAESLLLGMEKNPIFRHGEQTRINAALGVEWMLQGGEGLPPWQLQDLCDHLPNLWAHGAGPNALAATMRYRIPMGLGPDCVTWTLSPSGRTWLPVLHAREAGWCSYFPNEARYQFSARDGQHWIRPDGREWLLFSDALSHYPHQQGLLRALAVPWHMVEAVWRYWFFYSKAHGSPQRKVKVPGKQRENDDVRNMVAEAQLLQGGSVVVCPQYPDGTSFDFELVAAQYSTYETFPKMLDYVERWMTLCWLGAIDNTQGGPAGSRARAQVHERVSLQYLAADCRVTAAPLQVLLREWCRANRLPPAAAPRLVPLWQPPGDAKALAEVRNVNSQALERMVRSAAELEKRGGLRVDWRDLALDHGLPLREDGRLVEQPDGDAADDRLAQARRGRSAGAGARVLARGAWDGRGWERLIAA